jgi:N-acetylmuramic acid 6-phosphate (MurNAc-6-P) etherase
MQLTNNKLFSRATQIVVNELKIPVSVAQDLLRQHKSVRNSIYAYNKKRDNKK